MSTRCNVPFGSWFHREGTSAECDYPGTDEPGMLHWRETEPAIVPRLPIPEVDWFEVKLLNDFFRVNQTDYLVTYRFFWKECVDPKGAFSQPIGNLPERVPITDAMLDVRPWVDMRAKSLRLPTPELVTLPEPGPLGWLEVNNPAWLAVTPESWRSVTTPTEIVNGWDVTLTVRPTVLAFTVDQGGDARHAVACDVAAQRYVRGSVRFPSEPVGFTAEPNWFDPPDHPFASRDCVWTPRAKGDGTVTITITYNVTAIAAGRVFEFAPRTQTVVAPIEVVELRVVNVNR